MQCAREREIKLMSGSSLSQSLPPVHSFGVHQPGQVNMMEQQLDTLTSAMKDMCMQEDAPETINFASDPYSQTQKRSDPVYMAATIFPLHHHQQEQHQQFLL